jgi:hypothetical protein
MHKRILWLLGRDGRTGSARFGKGFGGIGYGLDWIVFHGEYTWIVTHSKRDVELEPQVSATLSR